MSGRQCPARKREPSYKQLTSPLCKARHALVFRKLDGTATPADLRKLRALGKAIDALLHAEMLTLNGGRDPMRVLLGKARRLQRDVDKALRETERLVKP